MLSTEYHLRFLFYAVHTFLILVHEVEHFLYG